MAISEEARHQLYRRLEQVLGLDDATTLMSHLPPVGWADVATKSDLEQLAILTRADIDRVEGSLRADVRRVEGSLRADVRRVEGSLQADLRRVEGSLRSKIEQVEASLRGDLKQVEGSLRADIEREMRMQTWRFVTALTAVAAAVTAGIHL